MSFSVLFLSQSPTSLYAHQFPAVFTLQTHHSGAWIRSSAQFNARLLLNVNAYTQRERERGRGTGTPIRSGIMNKSQVTDRCRYLSLSFLPHSPFLHMAHALLFWWSHIDSLCCIAHYFQLLFWMEHLKMTENGLQQSTRWDSMENDSSKMISTKQHTHTHIWDGTRNDCVLLLCVESTTESSFCYVCVWLSIVKCRLAPYGSMLREMKSLS